MRRNRRQREVSYRLSAIGCRPEGRCFAPQPPVPSPQPRSALTLIELLVVIIILTTLVAAAIPLMAPTSADRRLREASRGVNAFITGAQMKAIEIQRPFGVGFKKLGQDTKRSEDNGVCLEIFYVEQPSPFVGFDETSAAMVALDNGPTGGVGQVLVRFVRRGNDTLQTTDGLPLGWDPDLIPPYTIRPLDVVEVRGTQFLLTDSSWDSDTGSYTAASGTPDGTLVTVPLNDTGQMLNVKYDDGGYAIGPDRKTTDPPSSALSDSEYWTYPSPYKVFRQPMPVGEPLQLPEGTAIDLRASGERIVIDESGQPQQHRVRGDFGGFFHNPDFLGPVNRVNNSDPVIVMFSPEGSIERVKFNRMNMFAPSPPETNEPFDEPVVSNIYMLVGRPENVPPPVMGPGHDPTLYAAEMSGQTDEQIQAMKDAVNWLSGESRWIVIGAQSGRVVTVENAFVDPRPIANIYSAESPAVRRARQIQASREFAHEMVQIGGR